MVEVWKIMKLKILLLLAALMLPMCLSHPAISGQGCGTNWLGSDTNDPDFYVSKNQNLGADTLTEPASVSTASANQPIKIGQSSNTDKLSIIRSLTPDKQSPQASGTNITWTVEAADQSGLLYMFLLKGPSTNGQLVEKTNWTSSNVWIWNTTNVDMGDNQVEVRVRDGKHAGPDGFDDSKDLSFTISTSGAENTATASSSVDSNPHPLGSDSKFTKPRIAPDERPRPTTLGNPSGPNMDMPDPTPKPLNSAASADQTASTGTTEAVVAPEPEPEFADISGKWTIELDNSKESMELILIQTGGDIMGSGSLSGDTKIPLIASGSLDNDNLKLDVKTVIGKYVNQIDKQYKLDLKVADSTMSGSYEAFTDEASTGKGNAMATKPGT
jgi:hypothetical protein